MEQAKSDRIRPGNRYLGRKQQNSGRNVVNHTQGPSKSLSWQFRHTRSGGQTHSKDEWGSLAEEGSKRMQFSKAASPNDLDSSVSSVSSGFSFHLSDFSDTDACQNCSALIEECNCRLENVPLEQVNKPPYELESTRLEKGFHPARCKKRPSDYCNFSCKILRQKIPNEIQDSDYLEILVTEVCENSLKFYFNLYSKKMLLADLMDDLHEFYKTEERYYEMSPEVLMVGQLCAAKYSKDQRWRRVCILSIPNQYQVSVFHLDYGTVELLDKSECRLLHKDFEKMPAQAICGRLFNILPAHGDEWDQLAVQLFLNMTHEVPLMAELKEEAWTSGEWSVAVILYDTRDPEKDAIINDILIEQGFAKIKISP